MKHRQASSFPFGMIENKLGVVVGEDQLVNVRIDLHTFKNLDYYKSERQIFAFDNTNLHTMECIIKERDDKDEVTSIVICKFDSELNLVKQMYPEDALSFQALSAIILSQQGNQTRMLVSEDVLYIKDHSFYLVDSPSAKSNASRCLPSSLLPMKHL